MATFRHILWLGVSLKWRTVWSAAVATSIYGEERTSAVKLGRHVDPRASALAFAPQYSATQPDQKQHRLLHSSHSREALCPFHSSAHGPQCSDKTTCWRVAPNSMCHALECFFILRLSLWWVASCYTWLVLWGDRDTSAVLLERKWKKKKKKSLRFTNVPGRWFHPSLFLAEMTKMHPLGFLTWHAFNERGQRQRGCLAEYLRIICLIHWFLFWLLKSMVPTMAWKYQWLNCAVINQYRCPWCWNSRQICNFDFFSPSCPSVTFIL